MIWHKIIASGSNGNAVVLGWDGKPSILIDCGVPRASIEPYVKNLQAVLMTHIHGDHFNKATVRWLADERPGLRFVSGPWMRAALHKCGVYRFNLDTIQPNASASYTSARGGTELKITMVPAYHNAPNCGYKLRLPTGENILYLTDTNSLDGVNAAAFDLYMIEANYSEQDIPKRIAKNMSSGLHQYEWEVIKNHLSREKADEWLYQNMGPNSEYIYMHCHADA